MEEICNHGLFPTVKIVHYLICRSVIRSKEHERVYRLMVVMEYRLNGRLHKDFLGPSQMEIVEAIDGILRTPMEVVF